MKTAATLALLAAAGLAQAEPATYTIEPTHTFVTYEIQHFGTSTNRGRFDKKEGTVTLDTKAKTGSVDLKIDMRAINTGVAKMDEHLQSADIFDTAKFGEARFVGNKFQFKGDKLVAVSGELTLMGKTAPLTLKASHFNCYDSPIIKKQVCGGDFTAQMDRTQWGVNYGIDWGFPKVVNLVIQVEAVRQ
mgnify:CR=1 FL=1